ncbi:MAG TPA: hypothetical protein VI603_19030 [Saprospiraceae bacterium]|nr:hypothetical protein [Saprospiraceae bacterium]
MFANAETRSQVTGCNCDIELNVAERSYLLGKNLTWATPTIKVLTLLKADDFIRYSSKTLVSNQLIKGKGAVGAQRIPALKGGGINPITGARLPFHFHIHRYN